MSANPANPLNIRTFGTVRPALYAGNIVGAQAYDHNKLIGKYDSSGKSIMAAIEGLQYLLGQPYYDMTAGLDQDLWERQCTENQDTWHHVVPIAIKNPADFFPLRLSGENMPTGDIYGVFDAHVRTDQQWNASYTVLNPATQYTSVARLS